MPKPSARTRTSWPIYALGAALAILHLVLAPHVSIFGAVPDFLLVLSACVALLFGPRAGCAAGFACGLAADLAGTGPVGLSALLGCIVGYVLGRRRGAFSEGWQAPLASFAVAALAYNALYFALLVLLGDGVVLGWVAIGRVAAGTAVDVAIAAAAFALAARFTGSGPRTPGGLRLS